MTVNLCTLAPKGSRRGSHPETTRRQARESPHVNPVNLFPTWEGKKANTERSPPVAFVQRVHKVHTRDLTRRFLSIIGVNPGFTHLPWGSAGTAPTDPRRLPSIGWPVVPSSPAVCRRAGLIIRFGHVVGSGTRHPRLSHAAPARFNSGGRDRHQPDDTPRLPNRNYTHEPRSAPISSA